MSASDGLLLHRQFETVDDGQGKIPMNSKENPLFENLFDLIPARFERRCRCVDTVAFGDLTVILAVIRQDLVVSLSQGRFEV